MIRSNFLVRLTAASMLLLAGCSMFSDKPETNVVRDETRPVTVPSWYDDQRVQAQFPIPQIDQSVTKLPDRLPRPPDVASEIMTETVLLEQVGDQTWLMVNRPPAEVWPELDRFFETHGLDVAYSNAKLGLLQTDVVGSSSDAMALMRDITFESSYNRNISSLALQVRVSQGIKKQTAEIQVRLLPESGGEFQSWRGNTVNEIVEQKLIDKISTHFNELAYNRSYSLVARDMVSEDKVELMAPPGEEPWLKFSLSYERSWNSVGKALKVSNVYVIDLDRSEGVYFVHEKPQESSGWFDWFSDDEEIPKDFNRRILVLPENGYVRVVVKNADTDRTSVIGQMRLLNVLLNNVS